MIFRQLFDSESSTYTYLIGSRRGGEALLIDPVLEKVDRYIQLLEDLGLRLVKAVDTHVHADHVTGLGALRDRTRCITIMSEHSGVDVPEALDDQVEAPAPLLGQREEIGHAEATGGGRIDLARPLDRSGAAVEHRDVVAAPEQLAAVVAQAAADDGDTRAATDQRRRDRVEPVDQGRVRSAVRPGDGGAITGRRRVDRLEVFAGRLNLLRG